MVIVNPGGTGAPDRVISARPAPFPPSRSRFERIAVPEQIHILGHLLTPPTFAVRLMHTNGAWSTRFRTDKHHARLRATIARFYPSVKVTGVRHGEKEQRTRQPTSILAALSNHVNRPHMRQNRAYAAVTSGSAVRLLTSRYSSGEVGRDRCARNGVDGVHHAWRDRPSMNGSLRTVVNEITARFRGICLHYVQEISAFWLTFP